MKKKVIKNKVGNKTDSHQDQTYVTPNTNPTETTEQNPLQIDNCSHSQNFIEQVQNSS